MRFKSATMMMGKALLKALSQDLGNFDYLWALVDFYLKRNQPEKAMDMAERLIKYFPDQALVVKQFVYLS